MSAEETSLSVNQELRRLTTAQAQVVTQLEAWLQLCQPGAHRCPGRFRDVRVLAPAYFLAEVGRAVLEDPGGSCRGGMHFAAQPIAFFSTQETGKDEKMRTHASGWI